MLNDFLLNFVTHLLIYLRKYKVDIQYLFSIYKDKLGIALYIYM